MQFRYRGLRRESAVAQLARLDVLTANMKSEILQKYASLKIIQGNITVVAHLAYSVTEHLYIATLPASGIIATVKDEQIKLTTDMVGRIVCLPDGTISLDMRRIAHRL